MTQSELVDALDGRLRGLLQTARDFKNVSTVEPQLAQADLASSVDELGDGIFDAESTLTRALALEAAARQVFYDIIVRCARFREACGMLTCVAIVKYQQRAPR